MLFPAALTQRSGERISAQLANEIKVFQQRALGGFPLVSLLARFKE
jgi:hypothetical protein